MSTAERHPRDHGWIIDGAYVCDGCNVRGVHEHRCHGADGGPQCECPNCSLECDCCGVLAPLRGSPAGWFFGTPHPSDGIGAVLCPAHAPGEDTCRPGEDGYS